MAWRRAPIFTWAAGAIAYVLLVVGPALLAALTMLTVDRHFDGVFFDAGEDGEPLLFSHLSWIFFTGCHTILVLGIVGVISEIVPTFARKPLFSHAAAAGSVVAIAVLGVSGVDAEHVRGADPGGLRVHGDGGRASACSSRSGCCSSTGPRRCGTAPSRSTRRLDCALASAIALVLGLGGQLITSVIPVGLQLENTVTAQQDTIMVVVGVHAGRVRGAALLAAEDQRAGGRRGPGQGGHRA